MENNEADVKALRDLRNRIMGSLVRLQMMEDASDVIVRQATESGYRSGWYDGVMMAADELRRKGYKSSAELIEKVAEMAELTDS